MVLSHQHPYGALPSWTDQPPSGRRGCQLARWVRRDGPCLTTGQLMGLRENYRKIPYFIGKSLVSCRFSLKSSHWTGWRTRPLGAAATGVSPSGFIYGWNITECKIEWKIGTSLISMVHFPAMLDDTGKYLVSELSERSGCGWFEVPQAGQRP